MHEGEHSLAHKLPSHHSVGVAAVRTMQMMPSPDACQAIAGCLLANLPSIRLDTCKTWRGDLRPVLGQAAVSHQLDDGLRVSLEEHLWLVMLGTSRPGNHPRHHHLRVELKAAQDLHGGKAGGLPLMLPQR